MDSNTFMGLLIAALVVLFTLGSLIAALIIKPLFNLNKNITNLQASVDSLNTSVSTIELRLDKNKDEILELNQKISYFEGKVSAAGNSK